MKHDALVELITNFFLHSYLGRDDDRNILARMIRDEVLAGKFVTAWAVLCHENPQTWLRLQEGDEESMRAWVELVMLS